MLWHPDLTWFGDSPEVGEPDCRCSWCHLPMTEPGDELRLWFGDAEDNELRWHTRCFAYMLRENLLLFDDIEELDERRMLVLLEKRGHDA